MAFDCVEIDGLAPLEDVIEAQDLADRIAAMLTKLIMATQAPLHPLTVTVTVTVTVTGRKFGSVFPPRRSSLLLAF